MKKILFALANRDLEDEIQNRLHNDFRIVGAVLRKGQILKTVDEVKPDILVLRENIPGEEDIREIVMKIRTEYSYVRIVFLAGHRQVGDMLLSLMVGYGIYDIICGGKVSIGDIIGLIYSKNDYKDVRHLQPNVIFDDSNSHSFKMPQVVNIERKNVVVNPQSAEATAKMRKAIEEELSVKMKMKLQEEFDKDFQILMQKGQMKEMEIKKRLEEKYKSKVIESQQAIRRQAEEELNKRVEIEVKRAKLKMEEKLKEKERLLRIQMENRLNEAIEKNASMHSRYDAKEYEDRIRRELESELRDQMEQEKLEAERVRAEEFEISKQRELANIKKQLLAKIEQDGRVALIEKEKELRAEIEQRKNEELELEREKLEEQKKLELEKEKAALERQKHNEINEIRANLESKRQEELREYEVRIQKKQNNLKAKLEKEMEVKTASEIEKVKAAMLGKLRNREEELRKEMELKIKDVLRQNAELKNKYEADEYEDGIRKKLEAELREQMNKEKLLIEKERLEAEKVKEEELIRSKAEMMDKLKSESELELSKKMKELEKKSGEYLQDQLKKLEEDKSRDIENLKKSLEDKMKNKMQMVESQKMDELRRLKLERDNEIRRIEEQKDEALRRIESEREAELKRIRVQKEREKQEEVRRLQEQRADELRRIEAQREAELEAIERRKNEEMKMFEEKMVKEKEEFIKTESQFTMKNNQKIVSFIGGKNGVGTTTVAINVAAALADQGKRVLYIELNADTPTIGYWYRLDTEVGGLEDALKAVQSGRYRDIEENVIKSTKIKKGEYGRLYKNFPKTLDFLLFSQQETLLKKSRVNFDRSELKELYFYFMQNAGYEYIVIDLRVDDENEWAMGSILFSTKVYSVVTQDVASLAYVNYRLDRMEKQNIHVSRKNSYVINRLDEKNCKLKQREIKSWLEGNKIFTCPDNPGEIMNSIYNGEPAILSSRNKEFKKAISSIVGDIERKEKR